MLTKRAIGIVFFTLGALLHATPRDQWNFAFDNRPGFTLVQTTDVYSDERGFGFEPGADVKIDATGLRGEKIVQAKSPFYFSAEVPEGNYKITITLGGGAQSADSTIKAELRRLMLEHVKTEAGEIVRKTFVVNVRRPEIAATDSIAAGVVKLKAPREVTQEAWAWDDRLTLEFNGPVIQVSAIQIQKVSLPTLYILGDSTVCDQSGEPYASWGQMLPRWFGPTIAIANHAESGETYDAAFSRRRVDKILSLMKPGDFFIVQFGHNDQKEDIKAGRTAFTHYQSNIERCIDQVRAHGGIPLLVTPMERRQFNPDGSFHPSLSEYGEAVRRAGSKLNVPVIDLNAMSRVFYQALEAHGKGDSGKAFALTDTTHHNAYGAYELSRCVALGIANADTALKSFLLPESKPFNPGDPDGPAHFDLPPSPKKTSMRPLGDQPKTS